MLIRIGTIVTNHVGATGTTLTLSNVNCQGANRGLVVTVHLGDDIAQVSSVTFNTTENLTFVRREQIAGAGGNSNTTELWKLENPSNTTANVVVTVNTSDITRGAVAIPLFGVDQTNMIGGVNGSNGVTSTPSLNVTAEKAGGIILAGLSNGNESATLVPKPPAMELADFVAGTGGTSNTECAVMYRTYGAADVHNIAGTWSLSAEQSIVGVEIVASEQPRFPPPTNRLRPQVWVPGLAK